MIDTFIPYTCTWPKRSLEYWWSDTVGKWLVADKVTGELVAQYDSVTEACNKHGSHNLTLSQGMGQ